MLRSLLRQRRFRVALACSIGSALLLTVAPAAVAQNDEQAPVEVVAVDARTTPSAVLVRSSEAPSDPQIAVNGTPASVKGVATAVEAGYGLDHVVIVDNSATSAPRHAQIKQAAKAYVEGLAPNERVAVMSLPYRLERGLTTDPAAINAAIDRAPTVGAAQVYDAIASAAGPDVLTDDTTFHEITLVVASPDAESTTTAAIARGAAIGAAARINVLALVSNDFPIEQTGIYQQLAADTGGRFSATNDPAQYTAFASELGVALRNIHVVGFESDRIGEGGNLTFRSGSQEIEVGFVPNVVTQGAALSYVAGDGGGGIPGLSIFEGSNGRLLIVVLGAVAIALAGYAVAMLLMREDDGLTSVLQPYTPEGDGDDEGGLSKHAFLQRAVDITTNIAEKQGVLVKAEKMLEQANMPLRAGEALTAYVGIVLGSGILGFLLKQSLVWAFGFLVLGALIPPAVVNFKAKKRRKKFMKQLPDTLQLLAGTLKAGYSFMQGVEAVSHEVEDPMGSELRRVVTEAQLGRPVEEALEASALRMNSPDFEWAVMAVRIQREVGGNLAELLMTVAETMTARQRLRGEVQALTAEGRVSAMVLGILPLGLGFMLWTINPEYMSVLFEESIGKMMLGGSILLASAGFLWMKKIIDIKI